MNRQFLVAATFGLTLTFGAWTTPAIGAELDETSVKLFNLQKAATERDPSASAQYYLAQMYENGLGTEENFDKARELYKQAADQGLKVARYQLKELERAEKEAQLDRQRAAAKTNTEAKASIAKLGAAVDDEAAEAARRAEREKARAERKRRAIAALRKAMAAAKSSNPYGEE